MPVQYGADFYAVYAFFTQTRDEQTRVALDVEALVNRGALSASASIQTEFNSYLQQTDTSWQVDYNLRGMGAAVIALHSRINGADWLHQLYAGYAFAPAERFDN